MDKPDVDFIEGLSPAISIDQKSASRNPRSTVGTITEVYDYLRLLYARIGVPHCPNDGTRVERQTPQQIVDRVLRAARRHALPGARAGRARAARASTSRCSPTWRVRGTCEPASTARSVELADMIGDTPKLARVRAAHDRGRRRPARPPRWHRAASHRLAGDRAAARRGRRRGRDRAEGRRRSRSRDPHLQPAPRLPAVRHVATTSSPRATSRSTRPMARARRATGSARRSRSTPSWSCPNPDLSLDEGAIAPWAQRAHAVLPRGCSRRWPTSTASTWTRRGRSSRSRSRTSSCTASKSGSVTVQYKNRYGRSGRTRRHYEGVIPFLKRRHDDAESDWRREQFEGYMREVPCPACGGARLKPAIAGGHRSTARTSPRSATCRSASRRSSSPRSS